MILAIRHKTIYEYDRPVFLEPHTIRLTPRADSYKALIERVLTIIPEPIGVSENLGIDGSMSHFVWFNHDSPLFVVQSQIVLELKENNPFDFIIYPDSCRTLPMRYPSDIAPKLQPFAGAFAVTPEVQGFTEGIVKEAKGNTLDFLTMLCRHINQNFVYENRRYGAANAAEVTLSVRRGSCRDLAVLFMTAARSVGIASRFVSGYYFDQHPQKPELHAWVEVYIPGAGWRGYDPTLGLSCYGHHISLCACVAPEMTFPIKGVFRGDARSEMTVELEFKYLDEISKPIKF